MKVCLFLIGYINLNELIMRMQHVYLCAWVKLRMEGRGSGLGLLWFSLSLCICVCVCVYVALYPCGARLINAGERQCCRGRRKTADKVASKGSCAPPCHMHIK